MAVMVGVTSVDILIALDLNICSFGLPLTLNLNIGHMLILAGLRKNSCNTEDFGSALIFRFHFQELYLTILIEIQVIDATLLIQLLLKFLSVF